MARGVLHLKRQRLPGAAGQHSLPPRSGWSDRVSAHVERVGRGAAQNDDRHSREQPAAGWLGGDSACAATIYARHGSHSTVRLTPRLLPSWAMATTAEPRPSTLDDPQKLVALCKRRGFVF